MQSDFEDAEATAELEGVAFEHPLRDVRDAFGFAAGAAYQNWFYQNRLLLDLYRRLEDEGEHQVHIRPFTVNEDCRKKYFKLHKNPHRQLVLLLSNI